MTGLVDAAASADVSGLARVLLHMGADYPDPVTGGQLQPAVDIYRHVVLAYLVVLGHIGIEVVFPMEKRGLGVAVQSGPDAEGVLDRLLVEHRQRTGQAEAHGAHVGVGLVPEGVAAPAEQLGLRPQLAVHL